MAKMIMVERDHILLEEGNAMSALLLMLLVVIVLTVYSRLVLYYAFMDETDVRQVPVHSTRLHSGNDDPGTHRWKT